MEWINAVKQCAVDTRRVKAPVSGSLKDSTELLLRVATRKRSTAASPDSPSSPNHPTHTLSSPHSALQSESNSPTSPPGSPAQQLPSCPQPPQGASSLMTSPAGHANTAGVHGHYRQLSNDLIKEGMLAKKGAKRKNWTNRWFVLTQQSLRYYGRATVFLSFGRLLSFSFSGC